MWHGIYDDFLRNNLTDIYNHQIKQDERNQILTTNVWLEQVKQTYIFNAVVYLFERSTNADTLL